jgi:hypothetical protein
VLRHESGLVPLERFLLPAHLDGSHGRNRANAEPFIPMAHDLAAVNAWLGLFDASSHTCRNYRREVERLLLWAIIAQNKALSSLDAADLAAYRSFLYDPQPADIWIAPPPIQAPPGLETICRPIVSPQCPTH